MQNLLNVVMRRAGTDDMGKPRPPKVSVVLNDGSQLELFVDAAGPTAVMCRKEDGKEMLIPYTSISYILP
jgi:hypothetical protein